MHKGLSREREAIGESYNAVGAALKTMNQPKFGGEKLCVSGK